MRAILDLIPKWDQSYSRIQHSHYILITNTLISFLIPTTWVHLNKNYKIQQNETVKTTYVPNMIRIPTHGVNFSHQGPVNRGERRKEERKIAGRKRKGGVALFCPVVTSGWLARLLHELCRLTWRDSIDVRWDGSLVVPQQSARLRPMWHHVGNWARVGPMSRSSAHDAIPSWVARTRLVRLKKARTWK
jgi:hypothetical protein